MIYWTRAGVFWVLLQVFFEFFENSFSILVPVQTRSEFSVILRCTHSKFTGPLGHLLAAWPGFSFLSGPRRWRRPCPFVDTVFSGC